MFEALTPLQLLLIIAAGTAAACYGYLGGCIKVMFENEKIKGADKRLTIALLCLACAFYLLAPTAGQGWGMALCLLALAVQLPLLAFQAYYGWRKRAYDAWESRYLSKLVAEVVERKPRNTSAP